MARKGQVEVVLEYIGEGYNGDYDDTDPSDRQLLRFDVYLNGEPVDDASYCTQIPATIDNPTKIKMETAILDAVYEPLVNGYSIKKLCEKLSWLGE